MSVFVFKMVLVSLFGSYVWSDEEILEIRYNYDIVSILQFFMKFFEIYIKIVFLGNIKKFVYKI